MKTGTVPPGQAEAEYARVRKEAVSGFVKFLGDGRTTVFVMPPDEGSTNWHRPTFQHKYWRTGPDGKSKFVSFHCPKAHEVGPCALCDLHAEFQEEGGVDNQERVKDLRVQGKHIINVLIVDELDKDKLDKNKGQVIPLEVGWSILKRLISCDGDLEGGWPDITGISGFSRAVEAGESDPDYMVVKFDIIKSGKGQYNTEYDTQPQPHNGQITSSLIAMFKEQGTSIEAIDLPALNDLNPPDSVEVLEEAARMFRGVEKVEPPKVQGSLFGKSVDKNVEGDVTTSGGASAPVVPDLPPPPVD